MSRLSWSSGEARSSDEDEGDELDTLLERRHSSDSWSPPLPLHNARHGKSPRGWCIKKTGSPRRMYILLPGTASIVLSFYTFTAVFALTWALRHFVFRRYAYAHSVFDAPMIPQPLPVEMQVPPFDIDSGSPIEMYQKELDVRLSGLGLAAPTLACGFKEGDIERYRKLSAEGPFFFALNLFNNEAVFPTLARSLLSLAFFLGTDKVTISIFENGSWDHTTEALAHFAATLTSASIKHTIVSDSRRTPWERVDRIAQLSVFRNIALSPLNDSLSSTTEPDKTVLFVNDVFMCPRDALELLYQKGLQKANAACAMDWRLTSSWWQKHGWTKGSVKFYDNWVSRTDKGEMLRSRFDVFGELRDGFDELFDSFGSRTARQRFRAVLPVPAYSCWNGMLAIDASPFRGDNGKAVTFRSAFNEPGQCAASECKTVARDFWALGLNRWIIVPSVHVTYAQDVYTHTAFAALDRQNSQNPLNLTEVIAWSKQRPPKDVVCYEWVRGFHIEFPWTRSRIKPYR